MGPERKFVVGTSGYSFADWVGQFYPPATKAKDMFSLYAEQFKTVELNFTFYRMEAAGTLAKLAQKSPADFHFWVKANRRITHQPDSQAGAEFIENLQPMAGSGKLAGVLLQFPQSFHRTIANRKYLGSVLEDLASLDLAVEFRHCSWGHPSTVTGLGQRGVALVIPDCPAIASLYRPQPTVISNLGYLRLHSRDARNWYAGMAQRYDYSYSDQELKEIVEQWTAPATQAPHAPPSAHIVHAARHPARPGIIGRLLGDNGIGRQ